MSVSQRPIVAASRTSLIGNLVSKGTTTTSVSQRPTVAASRTSLIGNLVHKVEEDHSLGQGLCVPG
jgi:hypothetical protein